MRHLRRHHVKDLVVIDPCLRIAETTAYNLLSEILSEFDENGPFSIRSMKICAPNVGTMPLASVLREFRPAGIIALGSYANITDRSPWFDAFAADLREGVFARGLPLLGICFSHQFVADMFGESVAFVDGRESLREGKWLKVRTVEVTHPRLRLLLARLGCADYLRGTRADNDFCYVVRHTLAWNSRHWSRVFSLPIERLSAQEGRVRGIVEGLCDASFQSWARHEQEVKAPLRSGAFEAAATSGECAIEGMVACEAPIFTFQTHPDSVVGCARSYVGRRVMKNFIYYCHLLESFGAR